MSNENVDRRGFLKKSIAVSAGATLGLKSFEEQNLLAKMSERGQITGCVVDGPFALDNALSRKSCDTKGIQTEVGGDADALLMPDIEAANIFYKTLAHLTDAKIAAMTIGAKVPVVMSSRADSDAIKYYSILGAVSIA